MGWKGFVPAVIAGVIATECGGGTTDTTSSPDPPTTAVESDVEPCPQLLDAGTAAVDEADPARSMAQALGEATRALDDDQPVLAAAIDSVREAVIDLNGPSPEPMSAPFAWGSAAVIELEAADVGLGDCAEAMSSVRSLLPATGPRNSDEPVLESCRLRLVDGEAFVPDDVFVDGELGPIATVAVVNAMQAWLGDIESIRTTGDDPSVGGEIPGALAELVRNGIRWELAFGRAIDEPIDSVETTLEASIVSLGAVLDAEDANCVTG